MTVSVMVAAVVPSANGNHPLLAVTVWLKVVAIPTDFCASQKRDGSARSIGSVSTPTTAAPIPASRTRAPADGAARRAGATARIAHCLVAITQPSIAPATH